MPKIPVDECPAGPAMDAAVAGALGHLVVFEINFGRWFIASDSDALDYGLEKGLFWEGGKDTKSRYCLDMPKYSTDIAAAWELVKKEHMRLGWTEDWDTPYAACRQSVCEYGDEHPVVICRAFLKANGVEFVEAP